MVPSGVRGYDLNCTYPTICKCNFRTLPPHKSPASIPSVSRRARLQFSTGGWWDTGAGKLIFNSVCLLSVCFCFCGCFIVLCLSTSFALAWPVGCAYVVVCMLHVCCCLLLLLLCFTTGHVSSYYMFICTDLLWLLFITRVWGILGFRSAERISRLLFEFSSLFCFDVYNCSKVSEGII